MHGLNWTNLRSSSLSSKLLLNWYFLIDPDVFLSNFLFFLLGKVGNVVLAAEIFSYIYNVEVSYLVCNFCCTQTEQRLYAHVGSACFN